MFALVKDNRVVRTVAANSFEWGDLTFSNAALLSPEERKSFGIFDFVSETPAVPSGKRVQGSTTQIDAANGVVIEKPIFVDKSLEELEAERMAKIPQQVTRYQARAALLQAGYLNQIQAYMDSLPTNTEDYETDTQNALTKMAWNEALHFDRQSQMVSSIGAMIGLTDLQIDDLFVFASTIQ